LPEVTLITRKTSYGTFIKWRNFKVVHYIWLKKPSYSWHVFIWSAIKELNVNVNFNYVANQHVQDIYLDCKTFRCLLNSMDDLHWMKPAEKDIWKLCSCWFKIKQRSTVQHR